MAIKLLLATTLLTSINTFAGEISCGKGKEPAPGCYFSVTDTTQVFEFYCTIPEKAKKLLLQGTNILASGFSNHQLRVEGSDKLKEISAHNYFRVIADPEASPTPQTPLIKGSVFGTTDAGEVKCYIGQDVGREVYTSYGH